jgi:hypothetical protein
MGRGIIPALWRKKKGVQNLVIVNLLVFGGLFVEENAMCLLKWVQIDLFDRT